VPPEFTNQPIKLSIQDHRIQLRSKFGFLVFSHARVRPLTQQKKNPASMKLAGFFVRPDLSLEGRW